MIFPSLEYSKRSKEYDIYSPLERAEVIYGYLFKGYSHRKLDTLVLGKDELKSRGWQSMGILHYLGIVKKHKNIFKGYPIHKALDILNKDESQNFELIKKYLLLLQNKNESLKLNDYLEQFESSVQQAYTDTSKNRKKRLNHANKKPETVQAITIVFKRNPDVVVEVLLRADGICEECKKSAPFLRKSDNTPYLEVHHLIPLAKGGDDTVENAVALCPNCHRKMHFG